MQHLEVGGVVRHIYVVRQLRVNTIIPHTPISSKLNVSKVLSFRHSRTQF